MKFFPKMLQLLLMGLIVLNTKGFSSIRTIRSRDDQRVPKGFLCVFPGQIILVLLIYKCDDFENDFFIDFNLKN